MRLIKLCVSTATRFVVSGLRGLLRAPPPTPPPECLCAKLHREAEILEGRDALTTTAGTALGFLRDLFRSRRSLLFELAFQRHQLGVARRQFKRALVQPQDRAVLVFLSRYFPWRVQDALQLVGVDTFLRWHKKTVKALWRLRSRRGRPPLPVPVRELIREVAAWNPRFGVERISGELLGLGHPVHKRTVRRALRRAPPRRRPPGQSWGTFFRNHLPHLLRILGRTVLAFLQWCGAVFAWLRSPEPGNRAGRRGAQQEGSNGHWAAFLRAKASVTWACDFFSVPTACFGRLHVFFLIKLDSREIVHWAVTRHPTDAWTADQLRQAALKRPAPEYLVRDGDKKFGTAFAEAARDLGVEELQTPYRSPRANAYAERFVRTAKTEATRHFLVLDEEHLTSILTEFIDGYYQIARPHQGVDQQIPSQVCVPPKPPPRPVGAIRRRPLLNGLIHVFERAPTAA